MWRNKLEIAKTILNEKNSAEGITPDFKFHRAVLIKKHDAGTKTQSRGPICKSIQLWLT